MNIILAAGGTGGHMVPAHALAAELKARGHRRRAGHRRARRAGFPACSTGCRRTSCPPDGWAAGRSAGSGPFVSVLAGRRQAKALYKKFTPDAWSASAAIRRSRRCWRPARATSRPCCTNRMRCWAGSTGCWRATPRDRDRLFDGRAAEAGLSRQGGAGRQSGARRGRAAGRGAASRRSTKSRRSRSWSPAEARARACSARWCPPALGALPAVAAASAAGRPAMPARRYRRGSRGLCRAQDPGRADDLYLGHAGEAGRCHLVIARAGASTIAELTAAGRPAILVPLPSATDDHQTANAREMAKAGGARMIPQTEFTPEMLAAQIEALADDPAGAGQCRRARACRSDGPHAAQRSGRSGRADREGGRPVAVGPATRPAGRCAMARECRHEGDGHRDRDDPLRRHRRHRHVGHRRGDASPGLQGAGLATWPKAMSSKGCARPASR